MLYLPSSTNPLGVVFWIPSCQCTRHAYHPRLWFVLVSTKSWWASSNWRHKSWHHTWPSTRDALGACTAFQSFWLQRLGSNDSLATTTWPQYMMLVPQSPTYPARHLSVSPSCDSLLSLSLLHYQESVHIVGISQTMTPWIEQLDTNKTSNPLKT